MSAGEVADGSIEGSLTPFNITVIYLLLGGAWVTFSDQLLAALVPAGPLRDVIATGKGWLFVAATGGLMYVLFSRRERAVRRMNRRLDQALQQTSILHRVLRHNLRNTCNLIQGYSELLAEGESDDDLLEAITRKTDKLVGFSEKSQHLKDVLVDETVTPRPIDLVPIVEAQTDEADETYENATFHVDRPDRAWARTYSKFGIVLEELFENAVEHNDADEPAVRIAVEPTHGRMIRVDVADNGPGVPEMERDILEVGLEKPLFHSEGLGLWLVRVYVTQSGGDVQIVDNEPRGTIVRIRLPAASEPIEEPSRRRRPDEVARG